MEVPGPVVLEQHVGAISGDRIAGKKCYFSRWFWLIQKFKNFKPVDDDNHKLCILDLYENNIFF